MAAKASTAAQTRVAAEKTAAEASGKAKQAEEQKNALASRAREMAEKAKPKEVTLTVYSAPIHLKVIADEKKLAEKK